METKQKECEICGVWFTPAEAARSIVPNVEKIPPRPGEICISICSIVWQGLAPGVRYQKQRSNANTATKHSPATMG